MTTEHRERDLLQTFCDQNLGIFVVEFFQDAADIVHLESEVIQRRVKTRPPPQDSQADDTIADMTVIGLIEALCDPLHELALKLMEQTHFDISTAGEIAEIWRRKS